MMFRLTILITIDALLALAALYTAAVLRFNSSEVRDLLQETTTIVVAAIFIVAALFSAQLMESYDFSRNTRKREIFINIIMGSTCLFFLLSIVYYLEPAVMLGRGVVVLAVSLFALYQFLWHALYLVYLYHPRLSQRVLILGTSQLAGQMGELLASKNHFFALAGYASCNGPGDNCQIPANAIIGDAENLMEVVLQTQTDMIVVALSERRGVFPLSAVLHCKLNGIEIMDAPTFYERIHGKLMLEQITPSWIIFSSGFRQTTLLTISKRFCDIALSTLGLALSIPFFPMIALMIKLDSPGPLFFSQVRVGCREKPFRLYKLRSMTQDAEKTTGAVWAQKNDSRVTRIGQFLRNSRIDEIPQLYNVLKGNMSFIGPRPERPEFVENLKNIIPYYSKRHFIKPGLTGWAQVKYPYGASIEDAVEKLRYDLYYIKHFSVFLDLLIFFETIKVVLFGRGGR